MEQPVGLRDGVLFHLCTDCLSGTIVVFLSELAFRGLQPAAWQVKGAHSVVADLVPHPACLGWSGAKDVAAAGRFLEYGIPRSWRAWVDPY